MDREQIPFLLPGLSFHIKKNQGGSGNTYRGIHVHNAIELVWITDGIYLCHIGGECICLHPNDILFIGSNHAHYLEEVEPGEFTYLQADFLNLTETASQKAYDSLRTYLYHRQMPPYILFQDNHTLSHLMEDLLQEATLQQKGYDLYIKGYLFQLFAFLNRSVLHDFSPSLPHALEEILPAIQWMEAHFQNPLSLEEIGAQISCDKYQLCKRFKAATGGTVVDYLHFIRLQKAKELLLSTTDSILSISLECGFSSVQYFNRLFKRRVGCTPHTFRKHYR